MEKGITYVIIPLVLASLVFICLTKERENRNLAQSYNEQIIESSVVIPTQEDDLIQNVLNRIDERQIIKPYGIYISPEKSPVAPERFRGFHTGTDFEVFSDELNSDVPVHALCDGKITLHSYINGYGGVTVQKCRMESFGEVNVIYGHMQITTDIAVGDDISQGYKIGLLGAHKSSDTDGERKHLHLGIYKGDAINFRGYVDQRENLDQWINPCEIITCNKE